MFIVWSETNDYDKQYILFAKNSLVELKYTFSQFCRQQNLPPPTKLIENKLTSICSYMARENQFYFCEIPDVDANLPIYLFMFHEEGEGESWHNEHYFRFSNHLEEMMETAVDFFEGVSERTEPRHIARMKRKLQKYGYYKISHCEYYDCEMEMELFRPLTLNYDLHCSVSPDGSYHLF